MRALIVAATLLIPAVAFAQVGSSSGGTSSGGGSGGASGATAPAPSRGGSSGVSSPPSVAPSLSPTRTAPVGGSPVAPNVSPTQAAPVTGRSGTQVRPDPSPTQAAPVDSPVPGGGSAIGTRNGVAPTVGAAGGRTGQEQITQEEEVRQREAREARMRASEERLRNLIRDICTECDYGRLRSPSSASTVVKAKG